MIKLLIKCVNICEYRLNCDYTIILITVNLTPGNKQKEIIYLSLGLNLITMVNLYTLINTII